MMWCSVVQVTARFEDIIGALSRTRLSVISFHFFQVGACSLWDLWLSALLTEVCKAYCNSAEHESLSLAIQMAFKGHL